VALHSALGLGIPGSMRPVRKEGVMAGMRVERLDHLGIVAGVFQKIGLATYLDALAGPSQ
jgi:hypothetical protein